MLVRFRDPTVLCHLGKRVTFLYIAHRDLHAQDKWKALIPYYNLEGMHILANATPDSYPNTFIEVSLLAGFLISTRGNPQNSWPGWRHDYYSP